MSSPILANVVFCRISLDLDPKTLLEKLAEKYTKIIVSFENASRQHMHILIATTDENLKNRKQNLKNYLKKSYPQIFGNKDYSIQDPRMSTDPNNLVKYVIKDGEYYSHGISEEILTHLKKTSYKKYEKDDFSKAYTAIVDKYIINDKSQIGDFITDYVQLKSDYNQTINPSNILNQVNLVYCKKHGPEHLSKCILEKFEAQDSYGKFNLFDNFNKELKIKYQLG